MNHDTSAYGLWSLVVLNSAIFIMFAFSFFKPQTARDWRTFGAFSAFVVALSDSDKTVRGASAVSLGKLVDASTSAAQKAQVTKALTAMIAKESSASVKSRPVLPHATR